MSKIIVRPSTLALAFIAASEAAMLAAIKDKKVDHSHVATSADVSWVARRVYHAPEHTGMVQEQSFNARLSQRTYNALHSKGMI